MIFKIVISNVTYICNPRCLINIYYIVCNILKKEKHIFGEEYRNLLSMMPTIYEELLKQKNDIRYGLNSLECTNNLIKQP